MAGPRAHLKGAWQAIETASRDEIQRLQLDRLKTTLHHVYTHVPHYRARFATDRLAPHYLLIVEREAHLDSLTVQVEPRTGVDSNTHRHLETTVQHQIKTLIGVTAHIDVVAPNTLERVVVGKAKRVIDRRNSAK